MNKLEQEYKNWMDDFAKYETFKPVSRTPLQCQTNEFVFYYKPNSMIADNVGMVFITNKRLVFDIPRHGILEAALSDIEVAVLGIDQIEVTQGETTVHVSGNGLIMYTLIGLLKKVDGAKYVRQGYDVVNHAQEEYDLVERGMSEQLIPYNLGDVFKSLIEAYGVFYQDLLDNGKCTELENRTTLKVYNKEHVLFSLESMVFKNEQGEEEQGEFLLTDYRFYFKSKNREIEIPVEDISQASASILVLTINTDGSTGVGSYVFGNTLPAIICTILYVLDCGKIPNWISQILPRDDNDKPDFIRKNKRSSRIDELKNTVDPQYVDSLIKAASALIDFLKQLDGDENTIKLLAQNKILDAADKLEVDGSIFTSRRLFYVAIEDFLQTYVRLGYEIDNYNTLEGLGAEIFLCKLIAYDLEYKDIQDKNQRVELNSWMSGTIQSIHATLNKLEAPPLFHTIFSPYSPDICSRHAVLTYRLASIIAKADGNISLEESNCLASLVKLSDGKLMCAPVAGNNINFAGNHMGISAFDELNGLIGLSSVKSEVIKLSNFIRIQKSRETSGLKVANISCHCVFTGNPGTGKTSVARILARIFGELGVLKKGHLVETDRSGLVGEYVGQTAVKTNKVIDEALDGVLFIDEAYSLVDGGKEDYGKEAITTLLKRMEDDRDRLVVVLAGYTSEMEKFINTNPGLQSRFNRYIEFPDYTEGELCEIFLSCLKSNQYEATPEAIEKLHDVISNAISSKDRHFGNGRYVRNLFEKTIERQATRLSTVVPLTSELLRRIESADISD